MVAPFIGVILTLILYFSSHSIIQSHSDTLELLGEANLPQISKLSHLIVVLSENQIQLTDILINAFESLDEEQVYLQGRVVLNQLHDLESEFNAIFNVTRLIDDGSKANLIKKIKKEFINYRKTVINAIEISTVDVNHAKRELKNANKVRSLLNTDLLVLTKYHTQNLAASSKLIDNSLYDDDYLFVLTIILIVIMMSLSYLFANNLAFNLALLHKTLLKLSNGKTKINLPRQKDKYLEEISNAVCKFRDSLQRNEIQQTALERAFEKITDNEQRYSGMLKLIPTGIIAVDKNNNIVLFNKAAENIFEYQVDEVIRAPLTQLMPDKCSPDHGTCIKDIALSDINYEKSMTKCAVTGVKKGGDKLELEVRKSNLRLTKDNITVMAITDVTDRNKMEQTLRRAQKMDAVGQLCGGISHDFNNILSIILGNLELLERRLDDNNNVEKYTSTIRKSTQRAADLTRKLLGFSRHQATTLEITNINDLINDMKGLISRSLTPKVELHYQLSKNLKNTNINCGDFEDSLINLVLNARDAMPDGGTLTIETNNIILDEAYCALHHEVIPGDYIQLCISDTGQGIPSEQLEHVFEPFYTTKEQGKGTGLGLAMVFGFVSRSNASIDIYSEEKIGATFKINFPQTKLIENVEETVDRQPQLMPHGHETILVVDDEEELRILAQDTLQDLGYRVLTACDGLQAMEILACDNNIDILFTDVVMPGGVNGYQLAENVAINYPKLKVLLTSGYTEKALDYNKQEKFNTNILAKPYSLSSLAEHIRSTLDA